jgi:hypothetical protein
VDYNIFKRCLVPETTVQKTLIIYVSKGQTVRIDESTSYKVKTVKVPCNPILSFFGLLRFSRHRDRFKPRTITQITKYRYVEI